MSLKDSNYKLSGKSLSEKKLFQFLVIFKVVSSLDGNVLLYKDSPPGHQAQSTPRPTRIIGHSDPTSQKFPFS